MPGLAAAALLPAPAPDSWPWVVLGAHAAMIAGILARYRNGALRALPRRAPAAFWLGGPASFAAYALAVWGLTHAQIALVAALRETSIVFALLIGAVFLRERVDLARIVATSSRSRASSCSGWAAPRVRPSPASPQR